MSASYVEPIPTAQSAFGRVRAHGEEVERSLRSDEMLRAEHAEVESFVERKGREWARLMLEAHFALRADLERRVDVVGADGVERTRARETERHLETVAGTVAGCGTPPDPSRRPPDDDGLVVARKLAEGCGEALAHLEPA